MLSKVSLGPRLNIVHFKEYPHGSCLLCYVTDWYLILPISFTITSLAPGKSCNVCIWHNQIITIFWDIDDLINGEIRDSLNHSSQHDKVSVMLLSGLAFTSNPDKLQSKGLMKYDQQAYKLRKIRFLSKCHTVWWNCKPWMETYKMAAIKCIFEWYNVFIKICS